MEEELNQPFKCGCGKAYQRANALYKHVKDKHNGIYPEGSTYRKKKGR